MLKATLQACAVAALLAFVALCLTVQQAVVQGQELAEEAARELHAQSVSMLYTQGAARAALRQTVEEVRGARLDLRNDVKDAAAELAGGMQLGFYTANRQLHGLTLLAAGELGQLNETAANLAAPYAQLGGQLSDAASLSLPCDHNADCLHNRYVGTARSMEHAAMSLERTAQAWGAAAPMQAAAATGVLQDAQQITRAARHSWWARFLNLFH